MRKFTLLVNLYFLILVLLPCGDSFAQEQHFSAEIGIEHSDNHADDCSSLCGCACCGQITYQEEQLVFSFDIKESHKEQIEYYQNQSPQKFSGFVWQPPRSL